MRHHVQEKRRQRKHSHPRRDQDKIIGRSLRYFPWQQKTLDLEDEDFDFNAPIEPRESPERTESVPDDKSLVREKHPSRRLIDPCLCNRQSHGKRHQLVFLRLLRGCRSYWFAGPRWVPNAQVRFLPHR